MTGPSEEFTLQSHWRRWQCERIIRQHGVSRIVRRSAEQVALELRSAGKIQIKVVPNGRNHRVYYPTKETLELFTSEGWHLIDIEPEIQPKDLPPPDPAQFIERKENWKILSELKDIKSILRLERVRREGLTSIAELRHRAVPIFRMPAVYFLFAEDGELIYIGESDNVLGRIGHHIADPAKRFTAWSFVEAPGSAKQRRALEKRYIQAYHPKGNRIPGKS